MGWFNELCELCEYEFTKFVSFAKFVDAFLYLCLFAFISGSSFSCIRVNDRAKGEETTVFKDGSKQVQTFFTSGPLRNHLRKRTMTRNGVTSVQYKPIYGEGGKIIRMVINDKEVIPIKLPDGKTIYESVDDLEKLKEDFKNNVTDIKDSTLNKIKK